MILPSDSPDLHHLRNVPEEQTGTIVMYVPVHPNILPIQYGDDICPEIKSVTTFGCVSSFTIVINLRRKCSFKSCKILNSVLEVLIKVVQK